MLKVKEVDRVLSVMPVGSIVEIDGCDGFYLVMGYDNAWKLWKCFDLQSKKDVMFDDSYCRTYVVIGE